MPDMESTTKRVRVTESRVRDHIEPIHFTQGEDLVVGHRNQQFPEFVWCATERGLHGWVPESFIEMVSDTEAVARRSYDAGQLTVAKGDVLDVLDAVTGWLYCRNAVGVQGWVPASGVEEV
jgi:hypothetical protein